MKRSPSEKCRVGAEAALKLIEQGKLARQANEAFSAESGFKLRYHNRAEFIRLCKLYALAK